VVVPDDTKPGSVLRTDHNATFVGLNLKGVWMSKWFLASTARESAGPDTTIRRFGLACEISLNPWRANLSYSLDVRAARDHFFFSVGGVFYVSRKRFRKHAGVPIVWIGTRRGHTFDERKVPIDGMIQCRFADRMRDPGHSADTDSAAREKNCCKGSASLSSCAAVATALPNT
jgi:hypothetical protein